MMKDSKLLDDIAKMLGGAAGSVLEAKTELENLVSRQVERLLSRMQLATREELETVRQMAIKAREENEKLKERLDRIENNPK